MILVLADGHPARLKWMLSPVDRTGDTQGWDAAVHAGDGRGIPWSQAVAPMPDEGARCRCEERTERPKRANSSCYAA